MCRQGKSDESCLTCIIVNSSDFHYAKHMCLRCRRATGKRVSAETELAKENQICPHCGIIIDAEKHLKQATDVVVYRNLKVCPCANAYLTDSLAIYKIGGNTSPPCGALE